MRRSPLSPVGLSLALIALAGPAALAQTQERAGLQVKLKQGDQMRYSYTWTLEQKTELPGMPLEETSEVAYALDQQVEGVTDGVATVRATIKNLRVRLGAGMMGELTYDSTTDGESNPFSWLRHVVDKSFTYKIKGTGEVTEVTGGDAIRDEVTKAVERDAANQRGGGGDMGGGGMGMGMDPGMMMQMVAARLTVVFTDESLKSSLGVVNHVLPDAGAAANEGTTWSRPVVERLPNVGTLRFTGEFAHRGGAADAVRITARATDDVQLEREKGEAGDNMMAEMQRQMTEKLEVTRKSVAGTASFDVARGRLLDSEMVHEIDMEGPLPAMMAAMLGEQAKGTKLKQSIVLTLRYVQEQDGAATPAPGQGGGGQGGGRF